MIRPDPLTPCSSGEYLRLMRVAFAELDAADRALWHAWNDRCEARWPKGGVSLRDMAPADDPRVVAAEAKIETARAAWRDAHARFVAFAGAPLALVCAVEDWRESPWRSRARCTLPSGHADKHSWETDTSKPAERPVSTGGQR